MAKKIKLSELENLTTASSPTLSAGDVLSQAASNFIPSTVQYGKDVITPLLDPIGTAKSIFELGKGAIELAIPGEQPSEGTAKAVGAYFANRYGSMEKFKQAFAKDPAGVLGDISIVLTGGALVGTKIGPISVASGKTANITSKIDPLVGTASLIQKIGGKPMSSILGTTTGAGSEAVREAYKAGAVGGERSKAFKDNMRGKEGAEVVVDEARESVSKMAKTRKSNYLKSMEGIKASKTKINFNPIVDKINKIEKSFEFKGQTTLDKAGLNKLKEIKEAVDIWKKNKEFHTVEGLDALKKKIDNLYPEGDVFGKTSGKGATIVESARKVINDQIKAVSPEYAKTMKAYEEAMVLEKEIRRSLSLGNKAAADTSLRKLLSVMRNNVNTNFGNRLEKLKILEEAGGNNILPRLAGQSMNSGMPRGLQGGNFLMNQVAYGAPTYLTGNPAFLSLLATQSPRLVGEAAHMAGQISRAAPAVPFIRQAGQINEISEEQDRLNYLNELLQNQ